MGQEAFLDLLYLLKMIEKDANPFVSPDIIRTLMWINFPLFVLKQLMNVIQLQQSMKEIAAIDTENRSKPAKKAN